MPLFMTLTLSGAAISLLRGFVIAHLLIASEFSYYASIVAAAVFGGYFLSFGIVERTIKDFTRHYANANSQMIYFELIHAFRIVTIRSVVLISAIILFLIVVNWTTYLSIVVQGIMLAWSSCLIGLYASVMRATGSLTYFGVLSLIRALVTSLCAVLGAHWFALQGSVWGETIGSLIALFLIRSAAVRVLKVTKDKRTHLPPAVNLEGQNARKDAGGKWLFWAFMIGSSVFYLDRWFVTLSSDYRTASSYAFLVLFVTGAVTLTGIMAQKIGPDLVKMQHIKLSIRNQFRHVVRWSGAIALITGAGVVLSFVVIWNIPFFAALFTKYAIPVGIIPILAILAGLQITTIVDWLLIANDKEKNVFWGALLMSSITALCFLIAWQTHAGLYGFLIAAILGKGAQLTYQMLFIRHGMISKSLGNDAY